MLGSTTGCELSTIIQGSTTLSTGDAPCRLHRGEERLYCVYTVTIDSIAVDLMYILTLM